MSKTALKKVDRLILQHCAGVFRPLKDLLRLVPRGTLYRHAATLVDQGALVKRGRAYRATEEGKRRLAETYANMDWSILDDLYRPLTFVPTPQHRALIELILAAIVARQAGLQEDHHPAFAAVGHTLAWKTSLAKFVATLLGLKTHDVILDLATETGRSIWVRRDAKGSFTFQREILNRPFVAFDDVLQADPKLRAMLHPFLCGRKVLPIENGIVTIEPVTLLTLNPLVKATLEEQTTLTTAQLRRVILCNLDRVCLPDLAVTGHRALEAAAKHAPLVVSAPRQDCTAWRPRIVGLIRDIMAPAHLPRIDTDMLLLLGTGMTAFIEDPERAVQQTIYDFSLVAETCGWTLPDWVMTVAQFSLHEARSHGPAPVQATGASPVEQDTIILRRSLMEDRKESMMPQFIITDEQKAQLIAMAVEENIPFQHALEVVLDYYTHLKDMGRDLNDLYSILALSKELNQRAIAVRDVKTAVRLRKELSQHDLTVEEINAALDLIPVLKDYGLAPGMAVLEQAIGVAARFIGSGVPIAEIEQWLTDRETQNTGSKRIRDEK